MVHSFFIIELAFTIFIVNEITKVTPVRIIVISLCFFSVSDIVIGISFPVVTLNDLVVIFDATYLLPMQTSVPVYRLMLLDLSFGKAVL